MKPEAGQYWKVVETCVDARLNVGTGVYLISTHPNSHLMFVCHSFEIDRELLIHKSDFLLGHLEFVG